MSASQQTEVPSSGQPLLVSVDDYAERAHQLLPLAIGGYYNGGAGNERTLRRNCRAFECWHLRPRFLRNVASRSTDCQLLGLRLRSPIGIAPTAMQRMAHADGELASARAAEASGTLFVMSTLSTVALEDVAQAAPGAKRWFQLYIYKDRAMTERLVRRAEAAGFSALVLTVDSPTFGVRRRDVRNCFELPAGMELRNFSGEQAGVQSQSTDESLPMDQRSGIHAYVNEQFDATLTWADVRWLIGFSRLPVLVKGVMSAEDGRLAVEAGCSGVIVSNHGARQLDTVQSSIEALPAIVRAVDGRIPVLMDGGIRDGSDAFKAIALGAAFVFVGRPILWGLSVGGQSGVERVLRILHDEFDRTMALTGVTRVADIGREYVMRATCCRGDNTDDDNDARMMTSKL